MRDFLARSGKRMSSNSLQPSRTPRPTWPTRREWREIHGSQRVGPENGHHVRTSRRFRRNRPFQRADPVRSGGPGAPPRKCRIVPGPHRGLDARTPCVAVGPVPWIGTPYRTRPTGRRPGSLPIARRPAEGAQHRCDGQQPRLGEGASDWLTHLASESPAHELRPPRRRRDERARSWHNHESKWTDCVSLSGCDGRGRAGAGSRGSFAWARTLPAATVRSW